MTVVTVDDFEQPRADLLVPKSSCAIAREFCDCRLDLDTLELRQGEIYNLDERDP